MKISSEKTKESEKTNLSEKIKEEKTKEYLAQGGAPFKDMLSMTLDNDGKIYYGTGVLGLPLSSLNAMKSDFLYDTMSMNRDDADFFLNMVTEGQFSLGISQTETNNFTLKDVGIAPSNEVQKNIEVSKTLVNLIEKSMQTQKPVRIDFDNNISVIMKIDREGKISADFIPSNNEVERYLRNNIPLLVQRFEEQNLPYKELTYRQAKQNNKGE